MEFGRSPWSPNRTVIEPSPLRTPVMLLTLYTPVSFGSK
jgi:hypothetical protein